MTWLYQPLLPSLAVSTAGTLTRTLDDVARTIVGTVAVAGTLTATLGPATLAATATAPVTGSLTQTLEGVGLSASGALGAVTTGSLTQTLAPLTGTATGTVSTGTLGTLAQTLAPVTGAATGTVAESPLPSEPIEEQILAAIVARLAALVTVGAGYWYPPKFVARAYRPLDAVNDLPGYLVLRAPEESGAELQTIDYPGSAVIATMGIEVLAYGSGSDVEPTDRVLIRLLAQAERALCAPGLFGPGAAPENQIELTNTRRVLDHETEVGPPYRSLMSHLYRVRYFYTRGEP